MSADSPRRSCKSGGAVVRPLPFSDKSVMESFVGFIQDVAYSGGSSKQDDREKVLWVRFQEADVNGEPLISHLQALMEINDLELINIAQESPWEKNDVRITLTFPSYSKDLYWNPDLSSHSNSLSPLLLVIGYTNGVQIWTIPGSGEAQEVLSLRQGPVRALQVLPNPQPTFGRADLYRCKRPLVAFSDASSTGQSFCLVKFLSLRSGEEVHQITFSHPVTDIKSNERVVVVAFPEKIAAFDACQFKQVFWITSCYPSPGPNPNPIALGSRWLAYADKKLVLVHQSGGGMSGDGGQSYAATVISAAKTITKGLTIFGETVASSLTGMKPPSSSSKKEPTVAEQNGCRPGIVTIIDILQTGEGPVSVQEDCEGKALVAHFPAHATEPVTAMAFDPSGTMLLTCDRLGHNFHLFRIMAHPWNCSLGAVHHLYTLFRGDTTAKIQDISFTNDSRWVAVTTLRGTTHIFPITTYGGPVNVRTHTSRRVVNRASRFHRSAGLEDISGRPSGRDSPVHAPPSPGSSPGRHDPYRHLNTLNNNISNPRLRPYPHPCTVTPAVQVKQTVQLPGLGSSGPKGKGHGQGTPSVESVCVATCFARSRGWVAGSPNMTRDKSEERRAMDSMYAANWHGQVVEYVLEPQPKVVGSDKLTEDSPIEVVELPRAQWTLCRSATSAELKPPLASNNPLILACDAVMSQKSSNEAVMSQGMGPRQESRESLSSDHSSKEDLEDTQWLSQVEIITHQGPHRRLWMGPQFSFKTFQGSGTTILASNSSVLLSQTPDAPHLTAIDLVTEDMDLQSLKISPSRSSPMAMPGGRPRSQRLSSGGSDQNYPSPGTGTIIEAGSYGEQSPSLLEAWQDSVPLQSGEANEDQLKETIADAMADLRDTKHHHTQAHHGDTGSIENLSTSSGSTSSATRGHSFDATHPKHSLEHVLVFPGGNGSPDST